MNAQKLKRTVWGLAFILTISSICFISCGKKSNPTSVSNVPAVPALSNPANGATNVATTPTLTWNSSKGATSYNLQVSSKNDFTTIAVNQTNLTGANYTVNGLSLSTVYYWRVSATNTFGTSGWSTVWSFTTGSTINHPPNAPSNPNPPDQATNQPTTLTLSWTCTDPDSGDTLKYDVYLGTTNPPTTLVSPNQSGTSYGANGVSANTLYYWEIIAKDNHSATTSGPVWRFTTGSGGSSGWFSQNSGTTNTLSSVHFPVDALTGYIVGDVGTILKTTDGGSNWVGISSGTTQWLYSVHFPHNIQTGYAVGSSGAILKTVNAGANWTSQTVNARIIHSVSFPVDDQIGYAVAESKNIMKTTDRGMTWVNQIPGGGPTLYSVHFPVDIQTGYAVGDTIWPTGATILKTTDGGANWIQQTSPTMNILHSIYFPLDALTGYAAGWYGTILKTTNGGVNWFSQTSGTIEDLFSINFPANVQTGYAVGRSGTILKTTTGGATWATQTSGTTENLWSVNFPVNSQTGYVVGWSGTILKTTTGGI